MQSFPKLSVITVVYNASDRIRETIDSVLMQDYDDIEYIIKDGGSTDGTLDIIKEYAGRNDNIIILSERDEGIYDAMNASVAMATGDVIEFLNAGDRFVSENTVSKAIHVMLDTDSDVVYGDVLYVFPDGSEKVRAYPQSCSQKVYFLTGDAINHQVMFASKKLFEGNLFDTSYRICADREWMLRAGVYAGRCKMKALGMIVAAYPLDGASVINSALYKQEAGRCIRRHMPIGYPVYALFEFFRSHAGLSAILHKIYEKLYCKETPVR